jgi:predicted TIM-barrel fold metal-dependent hydrolase
MGPPRAHDAEIDVFDCHHHVGDVAALLDGRHAVAPNAPVNTPANAPATPVELVETEMAQRLAIMDAGGVRQAAVIPGHAYERPNGIADTRRVNDEIAAYRDARPDRFPVAIGVAEPLYGHVSLAELGRMKDELGLRGVSFHARFQGVSMDNPWILRYVERMAELGLVPVLHALTESVDEALWKTAAIARAFPDRPMLVLDAFSSFEGTKECDHVAESCPNLLFDTSLSYNFDLIEAFVRRHGAQRVVFGTDLYSPPVGRRISHLLAQIADSSLPPDDKTAILGANARGLFGADP